MPICIHMDPIATEDETTNRVRQQMNDFLREIDPALSMHDFRMVMGQDRINLIFDVVVPHQCEKTDKQLGAEIEGEIKKINPNYYAVITLDRMYSRNIEEEAPH